MPSFLPRCGGKPLDYWEHGNSGMVRSALGHGKFGLAVSILADTGHVQTAQAVRHSKIVSSKRAAARLSGVYEVASKAMIRAYV
jgi:hypothetical protein